MWLFFRRRWWSHSQLTNQPDQPTPLLLLSLSLFFRSHPTKDFLSSWFTPSFALCLIFSILIFDFRDLFPLNMHWVEKEESETAQGDHLLWGETWVLWPLGFFSISYALPPHSKFTSCLLYFVDNSSLIISSDVRDTHFKKYIRRLIVILLCLHLHQHNTLKLITFKLVCHQTREIKAAQSRSDAYESRRRAGAKLLSAISHLTPR